MTRKPLIIGLRVKGWSEREKKRTAIKNNFLSGKAVYLHMQARVRVRKLHPPHTYTHITKYEHLHTGCYQHQTRNDIKSAGSVWIERFR